VEKSDLEIERPDIIFFIIAMLLAIVCLSPLLPFGLFILATPTNPGSVFSIMVSVWGIATLCYPFTFIICIVVAVCRYIRGKSVISPLLIPIYYFATLCLLFFVLLCLVWYLQFLSSV
jgi:hypothetical protein